jgi:2-dehydrotetronate isomerase
MPKFAANLSWMFQEWDFLDRFAAAADAGFTAVECLFPYEASPDEIAHQLAQHNLGQAMFNLPPGDLAQGERGLACLADRRAEFRDAVETALTYARALNAPRLHLMSGIGSGEEALAVYCDSLRLACEMAARDDIGILIEPINNRDVPGYLMNDFTLAEELIADLNLPNLRLQFDIYHRQIIHGDVTRGLQRLLPITGHIQISSAPERNEPTTGELDDVRILEIIDSLNYPGFVGCEYRPRGGTLEGLGWLDHVPR